MKVICLKCEDVLRPDSETCSCGASELYSWRVYCVGKARERFRRENANRHSEGH